MSASPRPSQILLVGQKIRQIRKSRKWTQSDLANRIGVTQSDLSRMENGEYKVGLDTLFRILQAFEFSMSRFFEEPAEVPEPANGSNTTSPIRELASISLATSFSGFCVGCSVFSLIDQYGTVMSSQKFEG